ncbi:Transcriptional-regulating factor 1 [Oryzias melastigma]|uniref:Transcriptional-regulating factor 1 n=1 Tax=Oryzias melastigma TaxID=30732 RepID=A0A834KXR2_ORYME|nr:uncharacterized protein LOC112156753 [Oryzias melastigma]XP_036070587.1 uncharacterized protein LOC112156753 [Oryzias melastigma]KAF6734936.1 Transcriptional-regulating factor 1 [Oryzias melastigma]
MKSCQYTHSEPKGVRVHDNMSDSWGFSSSPSPPVTPHSSLSHSLPPLSSFSSFKDHGNPSPNKVLSPHPYLLSPNLLPQSQVSSFQFPQPQVTSPHPQTQLFYQGPATSPSPHLASPQANPLLLAHSHCPSPQFRPPTQHHTFHQNPNLDLEYSDWNKCESSSELPCFHNDFTFQYPTAAELDLHLQNQNLLSNGGTPHRDEMETANNSYDAHPLLISDSLGVSHGAGPLAPALSQLQCSPLNSAGGAMGRWSSSSAEDFPTNQFFYDSYNDSNAPQPFCSPTTPGPSPHYPQTPAVSSPGPHMHLRTDLTGFHAQTTPQLGRDQTMGCGPNKPDSYYLSSDTNQQQHQMSPRFCQSQADTIEDLIGFLKGAVSSENSFSCLGRGLLTSSSDSSQGLSADVTCRVQGGGRGRGRVNQMQLEKRSEVPDPRLLCVVCKREFRSLAALNGHMRSHSGFKSQAWLKKVQSNAKDCSLQSSASMVMPVSVPVRTKEMAAAVKSRQRKGLDPLPALRGTLLYRSLMEEEENEEEGGHYRPPPMLCPLRSGPGLYCGLTPVSLRPETVQLHRDLDDLAATTTACPQPETLTSTKLKPRINLGRSFQADIPPLRDATYVHSDSHNALLAWRPLDKLEDPVSQQRVQALLMMAQSSLVPGNGTSPEHALHILSECKGDFLLTVEKLLTTPRNSQNGVSWSAAEKKLLTKSLQLHRKDFQSVCKAVKTKSVSECVEFYYMWKKKLNLSLKTKTGLTVTLPNTNSQRPSKSAKTT